MCFGLNKININIFAIKRSKGLVKLFLMAFFLLSESHAFTKWSSIGQVFTAWQPMSTDVMSEVYEMSKQVLQ